VMRPGPRIAQLRCSHSTPVPAPLISWPFMSSEAVGPSLTPSPLKHERSLTSVPRSPGGTLTPHTPMSRAELGLANMSNRAQAAASLFIAFSFTAPRRCVATPSKATSAR
jgi:hypothetical protein